MTRFVCHGSPGLAGRAAAAWLAGCLAALAPGAGAVATYDPPSETIHIFGPANTLSSIAADLRFPEYFVYDFVTRTAVCNAHVSLEGDGALTIGVSGDTGHGETLRFIGGPKSARSLLAGGSGFFCYHSVLAGPPEKSSDFVLRQVAGKVVISNSTLERASISISGGAGSRYDLIVTQTRFEQCASPLVLCSVPKELRALTFRSCGAPAVHRDAVLQDCVFENMPVQYAEVGRWRLGNGTRLTLINCTAWTNFPAGPLLFQESRVIRQWYLRLRVIDQAGNPMAGARVIVKDNAGRVEIEGLTGADGFAAAAGARDLPVTDFVHDAAGLHDADPHRLEIYAGTNAVCHAAAVSMDNGSKDQPVEKVISIK